MRADSRSGRIYEAANEAATIALRDCRKPTIAAISGYGMGGGCALALACDLRVGDATTRMGIPAARLGIVYGELDCALLYRQVGLANAKRVLYTGRAFDASDCAAMGLLDIVATDTALAGAHALAAEIADNAPLSLAGSKLVLEALAAGTAGARHAEISAVIEGCHEQRGLSRRRARVPREAQARLHGPIGAWMLWLGVDVGGTFTDLVLFDLAAGKLQVLKTPSTPRNQSEGILAGIDRLGVEASKLERMVHGTTVATNTALERDGARLAILVTAGHKDVLVVGRGNRMAMYNIKAPPMRPLVPRSQCIEVRERLRVDGSVRDAARRGRGGCDRRAAGCRGRRGGGDLLPALLCQSRARAALRGAGCQAASQRRR